MEFYLEGLKPSFFRRTIGGLPGELSIAMTSNRRAHGETRRSAMEVLRVRAKRCCLPRGTRSFGKKDISSRRGRVRTSTKARACRERRFGGLRAFWFRARGRRLRASLFVRPSTARKINRETIGVNSLWKDALSSAV